MKTMIHMLAVLTEHTRTLSYTSRFCVEKMTVSFSCGHAFYKFRISVISLRLVRVKNAVYGATLVIYLLFGNTFFVANAMKNCHLLRRQQLLPVHCCCRCYCIVMWRFLQVCNAIIIRNGRTLLWLGWQIVWGLHCVRRVREREGESETTRMIKWAEADSLQT